MRDDLLSRCGATIPWSTRTAGPQEAASDGWPLPQLQERLFHWPHHAAARHWEAEIRAWLARVVRRYRPSMRLDAEMEDMYQIARLDTAAHKLDAGSPSTPLPATCPWTLTELLGKRQ